MSVANPMGDSSLLPFDFAKSAMTTKYHFPKNDDNKTSFYKKSPGFVNDLKQLPFGAMADPVKRLVLYAKW
jgi:hypothetical protein